MSHWTDGLEPDADDGLVRPFTITRGRTASRHRELELITVIITNAPEPGSDADDPALPPGLEPEHRKILQQCRKPAVVAEIAAHLDLPVSVTKILVGDLIEAGLLTVGATASGDGPAFDLGILRAVREGLEQL